MRFYARPILLADVPIILIRGYNRKTIGPEDSADGSPRRNVDDAVILSERNGERASLRCISRTLSSPAPARFFFASFFFTNPTKSTTTGTRGKTVSSITLWYNALPQADSAQSVGRTFGEADGSHATRRGCRRS